MGGEPMVHELTCWHGGGISISKIYLINSYGIGIYILFIDNLVVH